jgi:voltage-gated potassium channel
VKEAAVATIEGSRVRRWQDRAEWPLTVVAVIFLAGYALPILWPSLPHADRLACRVIVLVTWAVFAVDYLARLVLADRHVRYFWRNLADLAIVALPMLRPLRLLRLLMLLKVLNRRAASSLHGRIAVYLACGTALLVFCASLAVLDAERGHHGASIQTFPDALWWSMTTITTVGYGDRFPVTGQGRLVAVGLMLGGIALLGTVTASIASWLIDRVKQTEDATQALTRDDLHTLQTEVRELRQLVEAHLGSLVDSAKQRR